MIMKDVMVPSEVAKLMKVKVDKVREWIHDKRLRAENVSSGARPRYRVFADDLEAFRKTIETAPKPKPKPTQQPRRRNKNTKNYV